MVVMVSRKWLMPYLCAFVASGALVADSAMAQQDRTVPRTEYFRGFSSYHEGDYSRAAQAFSSAAQGGVRSTEGRWIDSICYHTMLGECYYRMGKLGKALEAYESALKLYLVHNEWMLRLQFPATISASNSTRSRAVPWGASKRRTQIAAIPEVIQSLQGSLNPGEAVRTGGVIAPAQLHPVRVTEIVRCICVSLARRSELLGPAAPHDPLTSRLLSAIGKRATKRQHWSQTWIDVELGFAYSSAGNTAQAISHLQKSLQISGRYDHPMTGIALLELGKLFFAQENFQAAGTYFYEATFTGVAFDQPDVVEEGFRFANLSHLLSGKKGVYPPLLPAAQWRALNDYTHLQSSLMLMSSEGLANLGQPAKAAAILERVRRKIRLYDMMRGTMGARYHFLASQISYQTGKVEAGNVELAAAMKFQKGGSRRLFQIALVDRLYSAGTITPRIADVLYSNVLREATSRDWTQEPRETLGVTLTPHVLPMEHWFEVAISRKESEKALGISDRIKRHRFHSSLPLGGRLLSLRWILEAPEAALPDKAILQRKDLLLKYPQYSQLSTTSAKYRQQLAELPVQSEDQKVIVQRKAIMLQLAKTSALQELSLRAIAVRREASEFVFPPLRTGAEIKASIKKGQLALSFLATSRYVYAFLFTSDNYTHWRLDQPTKITKQSALMLRSMGLFERNHPLNLAQFKSAEWKTHAEQLLQILSKGSNSEFWDGYDELVVVPDGMLWYLPFEALQVKDAQGKLKPLISKVRIRYLPTMSLIIPDRRSQKPNLKSLIVAGKLYPGEDDQIGTDAVEALQAILPDTTVLKQPLSGPSNLQISLWDQLIVLDDIEDESRGPYQWTPLQVDAGRVGSTLSSWFTLPWGGPDRVLLPGYHTAAEDALKRPGSGHEVFLTICGILSTGTRTALISRWRPSGQVWHDLLREFVQELPHTSAANAWQRSVQIGMSNSLDPDREPRLKLPADAPDLNGDHPFLWAAYLLVDYAAPAPKKVPAAAKPAVIIQQGGKP
jgi:tetratricopeptide (TPR) repeat protein